MTALIAPQTATDRQTLAKVIFVFEARLPGWWWSVTTCQLTRDASCGPDARYLGMEHPYVQAFDDGFHVDHEGTLAEALIAVMDQALTAMQELKDRAS